MKKFILTGLFFFFLFFLLDKTLILIRNTAPNREIDKRLEWLLKGQVKADILIYGSSRGSRDIIASQISDAVKKTAYNLSYPGSGIAFHEFLLSQTLENNNKKPELVILVVDDPTELLPSSRIHFRLDRLYPLVKYEVVRDKLVEQGGKNYWLSKLFIIHQLSISNFDFRQKYFNRLDTLQNDGSMPVTFTDPRFTGKFSDNSASYNLSKEIPEQVNSFLHFLDLCNRNHIKLIIVSPPNFYKPTTAFFERIKTLAGTKASFMCYDTLDHTYVKTADYYYDDVHLKKKGAALFTAEIIRYIQMNHLVSAKSAERYR